MRSSLVAVGVLLLIVSALVVFQVSDRNKPDHDAGEDAGNKSSAGGGSSTDQEGRHSGKGSHRVSGSHKDRTIYSGPNDNEEWVHVKGNDATSAWELRDGKLAARRGGGIGREIELPNVSKLSFTVEWRSSLRFRALFRSDDGTTLQPDNCYDFVLQRNFAYLRKRWMSRESGGSRIVGQVRIPKLAEGDFAEFEFYFSRPDGLISIAVNGELVQTSTDPDPDVGQFGNWLQFISEDFFPVEVSELSVEAWPGAFPRKEPQPPTPPPTPPLPPTPQVETAD